MRPTPLATALLITLTLAACGGGDPPAPPAAAAPGAAAVTADVPAEEASAPMPTGDFRITSVILSAAVDEEGQARREQDAFAPGDKIYAAVVSVGSSDGLTLGARWLAADGTIVASAGQSLKPTTPMVTTFSIAQPEPWPIGDYRLEVSINDRVVETRSFVVR